MGNLVKFFLKHRMLTNVIVLSVVGLGLYGAYAARKEGFPEVSLNKMIIQTIYPGASASDVEINVTAEIEKALDEVEGIEEVLSVSSEGFSRVEVQADENATPENFRKLSDDVKDAVASISSFPDEIDGKPAVIEYTSSDVPIMELGYVGSYEDLKPYVEELEARIRRIGGVAKVTVVGLPDLEAHILVNPVLAKQYNVDLKMIYNAIKMRNLDGSGGTLESFTSEKKIVFFSKYESYRDVLNTNISMNADGFGVKLSQVATVELKPKETNLLVKNNGKAGAVVVIEKTGESDLIKVTDHISELLTKENPPENVSSVVLFDQSKLTRGRISLLVSNAIMGFLLVVGVLLVIFNLRTAIWTAWGIPFTLLGMLLFLKIYGISLNLISLGGFIIILGMLVDDAIVIAEEISSNREKGMTSRDASVAAVKKMWVPIAASSLTTMIAFTPLFALGGFPGKFIWAIPLMVVVGLAISLLESYFLLPVHLSHIKNTEVSKKKFVLWAEKKYRQLLCFAIEYKTVFILVTLSLLMISAVIFSNGVKKDPFPQDASEGFSVTVLLPSGHSESATNVEVEKIEAAIGSLPHGEVEAYSSRVGTLSELSSTERGSQGNLAIIFVYLSPFGERARSANEIMSDLKSQFETMFKARKVDVSLSLRRLGPPMGKPFEIRIISNNEALRKEAELNIRNYLSQLKGVSDIINDEVDGKQELSLSLNHDILSRAGLTVDDILATLRIAFDGMIVSDIVTMDKRYDFRLRLNRDARADMNFIESLPLASRNGVMVQLSRFAKLQEVPARGEIRHVNGKRTVTVSGNVDLDILSPVDVMQMVRQNAQVPEGVEIEYAGQPIETEKIFSGLSLAAVLAFVGIYLLIALMLNSYVKPVIIIMAIPCLLMGITFVHVTHGIPSSMMTGIAMIGLMGVIVNNSIILIHSITELSKGKRATDENIIQGAVSRLRPVLLTTITTVLGVLPTGYGLGGSDPFLSHMCLVLAYGLLFGTIITLVVVPVLYSAGQKMGIKFAKYILKRRAI